MSQESKPERTPGPMDPRYREFFDNANASTANAALEQGTSSMIRIGDDPESTVQETAPAPRPVAARPDAPRPVRVSSPPPQQPPQQNQQPHPGVAELLSKWQPQAHVVHFVNAPSVAQGPVYEQIGQQPPAQPEVSPEIYYNPGEIVAATVINKLNSDNPGPFIARIHSGPLAGSTLLGCASAGAGGIGITGNFSTLTAPDGRIFDIQAIALAEQDLSTLLATSVDHKIFNRFVFRPFLHFAKGMADVMISQAGNPTVDTSGEEIVIVNTNDNKLQRNEQIGVAVGIAAEEIMRETDNPLMRMPTTHVNQNEVFGVLFYSRVDSSIAR